MAGRPRKTERPERRKRGTGSARYHAPSKLWRAILPKKLDPDQHPEYFATRAEAVRWLDGELARLERLAGGPTADTPLGVYLDSWLETTSVSADWSPGTVDSCESHFQYLAPLDARPLASITRADLQLIVADLQRNGGAVRVRKDGAAYRRKLTPSYLNLLVGTWRRAFAAAVEDGLLAKNPAAKLVLPPDERRQRASWTPQETRVLVPATIGHRYEAVLALIFGLGLRIGEAVGLEWADVDWELKLIRVHRTEDERHGVLDRTKGRTDDWVRMIPPVEAALRRQQERQTWPAVYVSEWIPGKRASQDAINKHLKRLASSVGVRPLSAHAGRHAVGNVLGASGVPLATISNRLRHKSKKTTADWYLATEDVGEAAASELLEALFSAPKSAAGG